MAFGELTKQFAKQALTDQVSDLLDTKPKAPPPPETVAGIILGQVQAMQRACKEDQELGVYAYAGPEVIRVIELYMPVPQMLVLTGHDTNRNLTRIISAGDIVQLTCKVLKVQSGAQPVRVNFLVPKAKE